jgi:sulfate permease, SulP family
MVGNSGRLANRRSMTTRRSAVTLFGRPRVWCELQSGIAGMLISLAPALTLGLLAFAALGSQAAAVGIPAALIASAVGGAVFALLARGPMAAGGPATAPVLVLATLVSRVAADPAFAANDPAATALLLALVAAAVVSMGLCQIALGLSGLVRFARFVPQPVVAGFINGVALLAVLALLPLLAGSPVGAGRIDGRTLLFEAQPATVAVGLITVSTILLVPRLNPRLPATLIGLLAGSGAYALMHLAAPQVSLGPLTGALEAAWPRVDALAPFVTGSPLLQRHVGTAVVAGVLMALIGTLDLLLNTVAMDQTCNTRTDPRREVLALGAANVAAGLVGGLPLLLLRPRALHMLQVGGRSRAGLFLCCGLFGLLGLGAAPLLSLLPQVVLGGVMVTIAVLMADRWSLRLLAQWWRGPRTTDLQVALAVVGAVCAATLVLGFPAAVAGGALLSIGLFIRSMNRSIVRSRWTAEALPSRRIYRPDDEDRLQPLRARITVLELEGALFFGSADRVAELAEALDPNCHTLVLDVRRVSLIDASGAALLPQMSRRLHDRGITLTLAGVGLNNRHGRMLVPFTGASFVTEHGTADTDQAVEVAELRLLALGGAHPVRDAVPLEQVSLMAGLDAAQRLRLAASLQTRYLADGERLFQQGDPGDRLYVITAGSISVFSGGAPDADTLLQRYVSLSAGMMLGETAMLDGQGRSGDAVAVGETVVHALDEHTLQRLGAEDPELRAQVYRNVALHLSQRLRAAVTAWRGSAR